MDELINKFINLDDDLFTEFLILKLGSTDDLSFINDAVNWVESEKLKRERIKKINQLL